jgi:hypothetical protein
MLLLSKRGALDQAPPECPWGLHPAIISARGTLLQFAESDTPAASLARVLFEPGRHAVCDRIGDAPAAVGWPIVRAGRPWTLASSVEIIPALRPWRRYMVAA